MTYSSCPMSVFDSLLCRSQCFMSNACVYLTSLSVPVSHVLCLCLPHFFISPSVSCPMSVFDSLLYQSQCLMSNVCVCLTSVNVPVSHVQCLCLPHFCKCPSVSCPMSVFDSLLYQSQCLCSSPLVSKSIAPCVCVPVAQVVVPL